MLTPSNQDVAWATSRSHPWRRADGDGRIQDGDLVAFSAGVLAGGECHQVAVLDTTVTVGAQPSVAARRR
ncbi:hypothetical protein MAHJHV51_57010 [Mycobacterium avium subsp. hominissuis]